MGTFFESGASLPYGEGSRTDLLELVSAPRCHIFYLHLELPTPVPTTATLTRPTAFEASHVSQFHVNRDLRHADRRWFVLHPCWVTQSAAVT